MARLLLLTILDLLDRTRRYASYYLWRCAS